MQEFFSDPSNYLLILLLSGLFGGFILVLWWEARMEKKQRQSGVEKALTWKLPWVKSPEELAALEAKSPLWYVATVPLRAIYMLSPGRATLIIALAPIGLVLFIVLLFLHKI